VFDIFCCSLLFFQQLSGRKAEVNMPIKDKNNNILTTERKQYLRCKEHFQEVLNRKDPDELTFISEALMDLEIVYFVLCFSLILSECV
jgi:hypothetical protein